MLGIHREEKNQDDIIKIAMSHFINMDYQSAYKLAKQHPNDETALTILIQSIKNLTINEYKYDLIDLIDHNEGVKKVFDNLKPEIQTLYRDVKESIENDSILKRKKINLSDWLDYFISGETNPDPYDVFEEEMLNWQLLDYCRNPRLVQDIYTKLNSLDEGKLGEITRFLPKLIEFFTETLHEGDYVEICPIYEIFLSIYYLKESLTLDELKNIHTMTNCVLTSKYNRQKSEKFIEEVYDIFEKNISLEYLSWSIDITELVTFKTDGGELSVRFLSKILDKCNTPIIKNRISLIQTELIRSLCIDYNIQEDVLSGFKNTDNEIAVDDHSLPKFICIYTLDDNAGRRAQRLLIKKFLNLGLK